MNKWIRKYLGFYNASLSKVKSNEGIIISKLNGTKTNIKITISLNTLYNVLLTKYRDDIEIGVHLSEDKELLSITSDNKPRLNDLMFEYGGYIDEFNLFKHKYTLQLFEFYKKEEITASI